MSCALRRVVVWSCLSLVLAGWSVLRAEDKPARTTPAKSSPEASIRQALTVPVDIEFIDTPLTDVAAYVSDQSRVPVILDRKALDDAGVAVDTPVTVTLKGVTLKSALNAVLRGLELTWIVRDEALTITTKAVADSILETRVYPVGDLVVSDDGTPGEREAYEALGDLIQETIPPDSWVSVGGQGSVKPAVAARALVVSQSEHRHEAVEKLLADLRQARIAK